MTEEEPKHPYVTEQNAKVHLRFSIAVGIMSIIQIILGIVISELELEEMVSRETDKDPEAHGRPQWFNTDALDNWFYGDHVYVGAAGIILTILGLSVYRTRSRANGVVLSVMCFFSGVVIYPVAMILGGVITYDTYFVNSIGAVRTASSVYIGIQSVVILVWAFYTYLHACCNSSVRKQTQFNIQPATVAPQQQQVVYVPQQAGQYPPQAGQYPPQAGQYPVAVAVAPQQPPQYSSPAQPPAYAE